ncbi:MAG: FtsX-like permease family protein [Cyclobacteriaceae bacterium]|nr:FtsX-like permease family protein [Cyclobacteriaceae bacterium]
MNKKNNIPRLPHTFFRWYCQPERYEELHGDLEELFYERIEKSGLTKAKFLYLMDVIRCFQPYAWKKPRPFTNHHIVMFRNYSKTSIRSLMKNPLSSFINVFGLAIAIGMCVLVYSYARWVNGIDQFHENKNEVYLITFFEEREGSAQQNGLTPRPLGEMLREDFAQISKVCRIEDAPAVLKFNDNVFNEKIRFSDPEFLQMFTFPLKWGSPAGLQDRNGIILSEEMSEKYFGEENPVGKDIEIIFGKDRSKIFTVKGVAAEFPMAHAVHFNFLINFENVFLSYPVYDKSDWSAFLNATLIQVKKPSDLTHVEQGMAKYKALQNGPRNGWKASSYQFEPLATLYERGGNIKSDISRNSYESNSKSIVFLSIIGVFMLALACFNYINIAIVSAAKRLKEIGVRKSIGATRRMVITQFLSENIFVTFFALILGIILGVTLFIPGFEIQNDFNMGFTLWDRNLWIYLPCVMLFTGIASGIYPAFYISRFQVVGILKGSVEFGKKNPLTKVFLGFQQILACILIACAVMFTQNTSYVANESWGYEPREVLYADVAEDAAAYEQMSAFMSQNPNVVSLAGSRHHLGKRVSTKVLHTPPNNQYEVNELAVDPNYFETMQLSIREGRAFNKHQGSDKLSVVVNEELVKEMMLTSPVGQTFEMDSMRYEIIGVVKDFHTYSFDSKILPTIFTVADQKDFGYLSMKVRAGREKETYAAMQAQWSKLYPQIPFQGGHQEDVWGDFFEEKDGHAKFWNAVALISVLLAGLGLYGLMSLNVSGRIREFSIRKVLGAQKKNIGLNILRQYIPLFMIAFAIGGPVSYYLVGFFFDMVYAYHIPMNFWGVTIPVVVLIMVLLGTVSIQVGKVSKSNPVEGLKTE